MFYTVDMKHFAYVLYVGFDAQRNFCDKQNVLFYGTPVVPCIRRGYQNGCNEDRPREYEQNGPLLYLYINILFFTLFNHFLYQAMKPVGKIPGLDTFQLGLFDIKWIIWQ